MVSVVIPCYNAAPFVGETVESVLAQDYAQVEIVVVDDASTDSSWEVITGFQSRHPTRIRSLRLQSNRGGSHARNRGAEIATGDLLMFLDADDLITPSTIRALVSAVENQPGTIGVCRWSRLHATETGNWKVGPPDAALPSSDPDGALRGWLTGSAWAPPCAVLWRRDTYESTGGWDEEVTLNDDGELMMRALVGGARLVLADGGEALYRTHGSARVSVSQTFVHADKLSSQARVLEKVASSLAAQGRAEQFATELGTAYQLAALFGFKSGNEAPARIYLRIGQQLAGRRLVSPTAVGRVLERLLGLERKERLAYMLGRLGIMTRSRRMLLQLRRARNDRSGKADLA